MDLRGSVGLSRLDEALVEGGWMVVDDSVEPGRLCSGALVLDPAGSSSESSSSQPTSSSAEAATSHVVNTSHTTRSKIDDSKARIKRAKEKNLPFRRSLLLASAISIPCLRK